MELSRDILTNYPRKFKKVVRKSVLPQFVPIMTREKSDSSYNFSASQATGANVDCLGRTVNNSLYSFDVGLPSTIGSSVRVAYLNTKSNTLTAYITFSHIYFPP